MSEQNLQPQSNESQPTAQPTKEELAAWLDQFREGTYLPGIGRRMPDTLKNQTPKGPKGP